MPVLVLLGLGFAGVIVAGIALVAANDALERRLASRGARRSLDSGGRTRSHHVTVARGMRAAAVSATGLLVERPGTRAVAPGGAASVVDTRREQVAGRREQGS